MQKLRKKVMSKNGVQNSIVSGASFCVENKEKIMNLADATKAATCKTLAGTTIESKGSIGNQIECTNEQVKEFNKYRTKTGLTMAGGVAVTAGATAAVAKSKTLQNGINKFMGRIGEELSNSKTFKEIGDFCKPLASKAADTFKNLPKPAKAVLIAGGTLVGLITNAQANNAQFKAGQIDQKYTDKAKLDNLLG